MNNIFIQAMISVLVSGVIGFLVNLAFSNPVPAGDIKIIKRNIGKDRSELSLFDYFIVLGLGFVILSAFAYNAFTNGQWRTFAVLSPPIVVMCISLLLVFKRIKPLWFFQFEDIDEWDEK